MALLLKNQLLYLHIPKTGGNWLTKLLEEQGCVVGSLGHKHATYDLIVGRLSGQGFFRRHIAMRKYEKMQCIAVVRNPLTWLESWFKYQSSRDFKSWGQSGSFRNWHVMSSINSVKQDNFNDFVLAIHHAHPGFVTALYGAYTARSRAHVLRNETIREDFAALNKDFNLGINDAAIFPAINMVSVLRCR